MKSKENEVDKISKDLRQLNEETEDLRDTNTKLEKEC